MSMLDAPERARPIMEYVRHLENRVRQYQYGDHNLRALPAGIPLDEIAAPTLDGDAHRAAPFIRSYARSSDAAPHCG